MENQLPTDFLFKVILALIELAIGMVLAPIVRRWILKMKPYGVDSGVMTFTASAAYIGVTGIAIIIAMAQIGVKMDILTGIFSAIGLGVSLSLKESMANVAGGIQILMTKPFKVSDYIACGDQEGTVCEIEMMFTTLQTANMQLVVIPNATIVSTNLINYSHFPSRRLVISVPLCTGGRYENFRSEILAKLNSQPRIKKDPAPKTVIAGFLPAGNGITINLVCYTAITDYWDMLYWVNEQVQDLLISTPRNQPVDQVLLVSQEAASPNAALKNV